jgi:HD superfamily phosphodiesterase
MNRETIAGVAIPDSTLAVEATEFVRDVSSQLLFDHSRRVFLWASLRGERLSLEYDAELLYVGAMFHDVGLVEGHRSEHERSSSRGRAGARRAPSRRTRARRCSKRRARAGSRAW